LATANIDYLAADACLQFPGARFSNSVALQSPDKRISNSTIGSSRASQAQPTGLGMLIREQPATANECLDDFD
jgi:hypothetical protein